MSWSVGDNTSPPNSVCQLGTNHRVLCLTDIGSTFVQQCLEVLATKLRQTDTHLPTLGWHKGWHLTKVFPMEACFWEAYTNLCVDINLNNFLEKIMTKTSMTDIYLTARLYYTFSFSHIITQGMNYHNIYLQSISTELEMRCVHIALYLCVLS